MAATTETNKTEIDQLGQATTKQASDIANQAAEIASLNAELDRLKVSKNKTPAKPPPVFDSKKLCFHTWAAFAKNYFNRTSINPAENVGLLLTYLNPEDYSAVCRVYNIDNLVDERYEKAVDMISHIISDKVDRNKAVSRLMGLKQGDMSINRFIQKLSELAEIGFPEANMKSAKQRCLTSALQANVSSKLLSYEIHRFLTSNPLIPFEDLSLHVLELEQVLAGEEEGDEEPDWAMNPRRQGDVLNVEDYEMNSTQIRRCYLCQSPNHIQRYCPSARRYGSKRCYECQSPYHLWRDCPYIEQEILPNQDYNSSHNRPDDNDDWRHDNVNMVNDQEQKDKDRSMYTDEGQDQELQLNYHFPEGLLTS